MKVGIVNYGMGNIASVYRALETIGYDPFVAHYADQLRAASRIVLPGVGAFAEGMDRLHEGGWSDEISRLVRDEERPLLGVCLGMQFLAEHGDEGGEREGLGFISGRIEHLRDHRCTERIPHVGWNEVRIGQPDVLLTDIPDGTDFYFVHSYGFRVADPETQVAAVRYGVDVAAVVRSANVWGTQFHPEKSSKAGLQILRNFVERS